MKPLTEAILCTFLIVLTVLVCVYFVDYSKTKKLKDENLKLDNQIKKYQVGIDSLRYDLEKTFYEKRKEQK